MILSQDSLTWSSSGVRGEVSEIVPRILGGQLSRPSGRWRWCTTVGLEDAAPSWAWQGRRNVSGDWVLRSHLNPGRAQNPQSLRTLSVAHSLHFTGGRTEGQRWVVMTHWQSQTKASWTSHCPCTEGPKRKGVGPLWNWLGTLAPISPHANHLVLFCFFRAWGLSMSLEELCT